MRQLHVSWKRLSLSLLLILIAVGSYTTYRIFATPSGQSGSIEGGGFCGGDYTVFNNTVNNNIYAMNCQTGFNDYGPSSDTAVILNDIVAAVANGVHIEFRSGQFNFLTTAYIGENGINLGGTITGFQDNPFTWNAYYGTLFMAKVNSLTLIAASTNSHLVTCPSTGCTGANRFTGTYLHDFGVTNNGYTGVVGIDWRMAEASAGNVFSNLFMCDGTAGGAFSMGLYADGNEDTVLQDSYFCGDVTSTWVQWQTPLGNVDIIGTVMGGLIDLQTYAQQVLIEGGTINSVKLLGAIPTGSYGNLKIDGCYLGNVQGTGLIQLNGFNLTNVKITSSVIHMTSTIPLYSGAGTVRAAMFASDTWAFGASSNWNAGGATLTNQHTDTANWVVSGSAPTNFPFSIVSSNF